MVNAEPDRTARREPRVVILGTSAGSEVEVLQVPLPARVGSEFCHRGNTWKVTGCRHRSRVLFAEPVER